MCSANWDTTNRNAKYGIMSVRPVIIPIIISSAPYDFIVRNIVGMTISKVVIIMQH